MTNCRFSCCMQVLIIPCVHVESKMNNLSPVSYSVRNLTCTFFKLQFLKLAMVGTNG